MFFATGKQVKCEGTSKNKVPYFIPAERIPALS